MELTTTRTDAPIARTWNCHADSGYLCVNQRVHSPSDTNASRELRVAAVNRDQCWRTASWLLKRDCAPHTTLRPATYTVTFSARDPHPARCLDTAAKSKLWKRGMKWSWLLSFPFARRRFGSKENCFPRRIYVNLNVGRLHKCPSPCSFENSCQTDIKRNPFVYRRRFDKTMHPTVSLPREDRRFIARTATSLHRLNG